MTKKKMIVGIVAIFLAINMIWVINYYSYYKGTAAYMKSPVNYIKSGSSYTYTIDCPSYLSFVGNYAITNNDDLSLIVWPPHLFTQSYEYGVGIYDDQNKITYRFYVNDKLEILRSNNEYYNEQELALISNKLIKNKNELMKMVQLAKDEWGI